MRKRAERRGGEKRKGEERRERERERGRVGERTLCRGKQ